MIDEEESKFMVGFLKFGKFRWTKAWAGPTSAVEETTRVIEYPVPNLKTMKSLHKFTLTRTTITI